jgi:transposase InsO family protein
MFAPGALRFFSSLTNERTARADVFDDIERFYNPRRRHSTDTDDSIVPSVDLGMSISGARPPRATATKTTGVTGRTPAAASPVATATPT